MSSSQARANGRATSKDGAHGPFMKKGPWSPSEDELLIEYVRKHGEGNWKEVAQRSGLQRCGKSCRLRWTNQLQPHLRKDRISPAEESAILLLHSIHGNKWAKISAQLPGRTDNAIKNFMNTRAKRQKRQAPGLARTASTTSATSYPNSRSHLDFIASSPAAASPAARAHPVYVQYKIPVTAAGKQPISAMAQPSMTSGRSASLYDDWWSWWSRKDTAPGSSAIYNVAAGLMTSSSVPSSPAHSQSNVDADQLAQLALSLPPFTALVPPMQAPYKNMQPQRSNWNTYNASSSNDSAHISSNKFFTSNSTCSRDVKALMEASHCDSLIGPASAGGHHMQHISMNPVQEPPSVQLTSPSVESFIDPLALLGGRSLSLFKDAPLSPNNSAEPLIPSNTASSNGTGSPSYISNLYAQSDSGLSSIISSGTHDCQLYYIDSECTLESMIKPLQRACCNMPAILPQQVTSQH